MLPSDNMIGAESTGKAVSLMRRRYQRGTLLKRGKKELLWVGRWLEDEKLPSGLIHRRYKSLVLGAVKGMGKREAQRELSRILLPINSGLRQVRHRITLLEYTERWKRDILIHHKPSGRTSEIAHLNKWILPELGALSLCDLDGPTLQQAVTKWTPLVAPKTVRNIVTTFRTMWKTARAWGLATHDPFHGLTLPRRGLVTKPRLTPPQAKQLIQLADEPFKSLFWILAETGIRGGEVCGLFVEDVDLTALLIHVRRSAWRGRLQTPKTANAVRTFPVSPELAAHLTGYLGGRTTGILFPTGKGTPFDNQNIVNWNLKPLLERIGIVDSKRMGLHAFRHGNATALDGMGAPLAIRMARLGHADSETTFGYTAACSPDHRRIAAELGRVFNPS